MTGATRLRGQPATRANAPSLLRVSAKGECQAHGAWIPALIAFYEMDCLPAKAWRLRCGAPLDYLDVRAIEALQAAVRLAP